MIILQTHSPSAWFQIAMEVQCSATSYADLAQLLCGPVHLAALLLAICVDSSLDYCIGKVTGTKAAWEHSNAEGPMPCF